MTRTRKPSRLTAALILSLATGCDNVEWGGAEFAVVPPPPKAPESSDGRGTGTVPGEERVPQGPILYYVRPSGGIGSLTPVGEIDGDTLRTLKAASDWRLYGSRFIAQHLRQGTELALFRDGMRAGTIVVQSATIPDTSTCPRLPQATGTLELSAGGAVAPEYLAMAKPYAPDTRRQEAVSPLPDRTMQVVAPILAERQLRARRAPLPGNWQRVMQQLKPFPVPGIRDPGFTATFVVGDTLAMGADNVGYSLFFVGVPQAQITYDTAYVYFNNYPTTGKAAPRTVDYLDWDRDGEMELLLEVFTVNGSWFEAVGRRSGKWGHIFRDQCARPPGVPLAPRDTTLVADSVQTKASGPLDGAAPLQRTGWRARRAFRPRLLGVPYSLPEPKPDTAVVDTPRVQTLRPPRPMITRTSSHDY